MINIIICDDNLRDANKVEKIVKKSLKNFEHKIYIFNDYDKDFMKILNSDISNKIYLLDIEMPTMSGIDVARIIRKNDYTSVIIFLSAHDDLSRIVAKKNLMILNFINKFDNLERHLTSSLSIAISLVGKKKRITLKSGRNIYNIDIDNILYVTRDTIGRQSVIVCDNDIYKLRINLNSVIKELGEEFIQIHRACFVNKNRIKVISHKEMSVTFDNGTSTKLVSKKYIERMVVK